MLGRERCPDGDVVALAEPGRPVVVSDPGPSHSDQIGALAEAFGAPFALSLQTSLCALAVITIAMLMPGLRRAREPDPVPFAADD